MQNKSLATVMLSLTALTLLSGSVGMSALAANNTMTQEHKGGGNSNTVLNITVNCNDGSQQHKKVTSGSNTVANVNVVCNGGGNGQKGDKGDKGDPGKDGAQGPPGKDAIVCIVQGNETCSQFLNGTTTAAHFDTKNFSCTSVGLTPYNCVTK